MSDRLLRINEAIREVLSKEILELDDPRIGFVTITSVRAVQDLRQAKVYYTVLGTEDQREATRLALKASQNLLQRAIGRNVKMHHTPVLQFIYDDTIDTALRIDQLLRDTEA